MILTSIVASLILSSPVAQAGSGPWLTESWDSSKDKGLYRDFRLSCEDLKWGLKKPVKTPDLKKIDALFDQSITNFIETRSKDDFFKVVCLRAYFGNRGEIKKLQLQALIDKASGFQSYEFARVAYVASVLSLRPLQGSDIEIRLMDRRNDDPLVLTAKIQSADFLVGLKPEHKKAIEYAEKLIQMFPEREARYRVVLLLTVKRYWQRSNEVAYYDRAMKLVEEVLADKNSIESEKTAASDMKRYMQNLKKKRDG